MKISIIIPVLKRSDHLLDTLEKLHRDPYQNKEIIIIIDEPDPYFLDQVKGACRYDTRVLVNYKRVGKSNALNKGVRNSAGELLFFLDSDNWIPDDEVNLISKILQQGSGIDVAGFKLNSTGNSMLAELASMDYMHETYLAQLHTRFCKTRPLTSGIALVVRKEVFYEVGGFRNVIYEDLDFTWRAFRLGKSYKLLDGVIHTEAPPSIRKWFTQRKRWSLGLAEWFFENYKQLPKTARHSRGLLVPWVLLFLPVLMMVVANYLLFQVSFEDPGLLQPASLLSKSLGLEQYSYWTQSHTEVIKTTLTYFVSLSICVLWSFKLSKSLGYTVSWDAFFLYYIAYAPTVLLMYAYGFLTVGIGKQYKLSDWKA